MFLMVISCVEAISKQDLIESFSLEERSIIQSNEQADDEVNVTTRYPMGGGRRLAGFGGRGGMGGGRMGGGGGMGKGGMGGGKGGRGGSAGAAAGGVAAGMIGGGLIGGAIANHNSNGSSSSATILSAGTHFCVSILILCVSFWIWSHFHY